MLGCTYALVALGMYVPFVLAGTLSMAYSTYAAIGGYAVAIMVAKAGLPAWFGWCVGPLVSAVLAVLLGWATRRLSGFYLVAVTLLFAEAFQSWIQSNDNLTGGEAGFGNLPPVHFFGWSPSTVQFGIGAVALICSIAFLVERLRFSPWGVLVRAMREVPEAVEAAGARVPTMQLAALAIGAAIGNLAGALFVSSVQSVNPLTFTLSLVFLAVFVPIVGGLGTAWGCLLGAAVITELTLNVHALGQSGMLIVAVGVLVILLLAPRGVGGLIGSSRTLLVRLAAKSTARNG